MHVKTGSPGGSEQGIHLSPEGAATAHFADGREGVVEKIL